MRSTLLKIFMVPAIAVAAALVSQSAKAETVNVPFNFSVMGKAFPAGTYTVSKELNSNFVTLHQTDGRCSITRVLGPGDADASGRHIVLRFSATGEEHSLQSIQVGSEIAKTETKHDHRSKTAAQAEHTIIGR